MPTTRFTFSSGTEAMDWKALNCDRCSWGYDDEKRVWRCELERAVDESSFNHGLMDDAAAERIGYEEEPYGHLARDCRERTPKSAGGASDG